MNVGSDTAVCLSEARLADIAETGTFADERERLHVSVCDSCATVISGFRENNALLERLRTGPDASEGVARSNASEPTPPPGYTLVRRIGRGGQGVVYEGVQESTKRRVAIKALPAWGMTERELSRVQREAELVASLNHPGIVAVFEGEKIPGGGYAIVMEYVEGVPMNRWRPDGTRPSARLSAALVSSICDAVHHAHERGVIHRDLKPSNILVDANGAPHVLDFGIAGRLPIEGSHADARTTIPALTPQYAAPEQCAGMTTDVRTDVYGLGVVLYELLCGRLPYPIHESALHMARIVETVEPEPPRSLGVRLDADLETIVLKALQKDPDRRYRSAAALADDLNRYLAGDAIIARQDNTWYRLRKMVSRHSAAFGLGFAALVALVAFAVYESRVNTRLTSALSESNIGRGRYLAKAEAVAEAERVLWREVALLASDRFDPATSLFNSSPEEMRCFWSLWEMYHRSPCLSTVKKDLGIIGVLFGNDSKLLRCLRRDGSEVYLSVPDGEIVRIAPAPTAEREAGDDVHYSADRRYKSFTTKTGARLVEADTGKEISRGPEPRIDDCTGIKLSPDGSLLAVATVSGQLRLFDTSVMRHARDAEDPILKPVDGVKIHRVPLAFSPDGRFIAAPLEDLRIALWETATGRRVAVVGDAVEAARRTVRSTPDSLAFSHYGHKVAVSLRNAEVKVWDVTGGARPVGPFGTRAGDPMDVMFSADDKLLIASDTWGNAIRLFNVSDASELAAWRGHATEIRNVDASRDGTRIVSVDANELIKFWPGSPSSDTIRLAERGSHVEDISISGDGKLAALVGRECAASIVSLADSSTVWRQTEGEKPLVSADFMPGDTSFASVDVSGVIHVRAILTGEVLASVSLEQPDPEALRVLPSGSILVLAGTGVYRWSVGEQRVTPVDLRGATAAGISVARLTGVLAVTAHSGEVLLVQEGGPAPDARHLHAHGESGLCALSADGDRLAWFGEDGSVHVSTLGGRAIQLSGAESTVRAIAWHPGGRVIVLGEQGGRITLWDGQTGKFLAEIEGPESQVVTLNFTPEGDALVFATLDGVVTRMDLTLAAECIAGNWDVQMALHAQQPSR